MSRRHLCLKDRRDEKEGKEELINIIDRALLLFCLQLNSRLTFTTIDVLIAPQSLLNHKQASTNKPEKRLSLSIYLPIFVASLLSVFAPVLSAIYITLNVTEGKFILVQTLFYFSLLFCFCFLLLLTDTCK